MNKHFSLIVGCLINIFIISAQTGSSWLNYTFSEKIFDIKVQEKYIWVATFGGLVKYNKSTGEKNYYTKASHNLPSNHIVSMAFDNADNLWMSTKYNGVGKFNINTNNCIVYNQNNSGLPFDQWNFKIVVDKENKVWVACQRWLACLKAGKWQSWEIGSPISSSFCIHDLLVDDTGKVWVCSEDGLGTFENGIYKQLPEITSIINCIAMDRNKNIWFGSANNGLYSYNGKTFTNYTSSNSSNPFNGIYALKFDNNNNLWLAANGLVKYDGNNFAWYKSEKPQWIFSIEPDKNDTIWCGTAGGMLLCFNGANFSSIEVSNSPLKSNYIGDLAIDNENNVWIGTSNNLVKSNKFQLSSILQNDTILVPLSYISALCSDNAGNVWVAFGAGTTGVLKMNENGNEIFNKTNSPFIPDSITIKRMIADKKNSLWFATNRGLFKYDNNTFTHYNKSNSLIPSNNVFSISCDKYNNIWGGTTSGAFKYNGSEWKIWDTSNSSLPTNRIVSIACDLESNIWFSCKDEDNIEGIEFGGGVVFYDGSAMKNFTIANSSIRSNTIFDIYIDNNNTKWFGTSGAGLVSLKGEDEWAHYNMYNSGIAFNEVEKICKDNSGNIWLGHGIYAGVSVFNPDSFSLKANHIHPGQNNVTIFPNPAADVINIAIAESQFKENVYLTIYDINSRKVYSKIIEPSREKLQINISGLSSGIYILNATDRTMSRQRLFIKR